MIGRIFAGALAGVFILANLRLTSGVLHEKCLLPVAEGNCSESIQRWFYNNRTGLCQAFVYRGCNGNANNFNSTAYCYHACNASADELHSYSISDDTKRIKGNRGQQAAQAAATGDRLSNSTDGSVNISAVTTPTNFDEERRRAASGQNRGPSAAAAGNTGGSLSPTREPTLILNRNQGSGQTPSRPRQPVNAASGDAPAAAGSSSNASSKQTRTKRSTPSKNRHHRQRSSTVEYEVEDAESEQPAQSDEENEDATNEKKHTTKRRQRHSKTKSQTAAAEDDDEETVEPKDDKKKRTKKTDAVQESSKKVLNDLLAHVESTASKLHKIAAVAKLVKRKNGDRRPSEEDEEVEDGEEQGKELDAEMKKTAGDEEEGKHDSEKENDSKDKSKKSNDVTSSRRRHSSRRKTHQRKSSSTTTTKRQSASKAGGKLVDVTVIGGNGIATASLAPRKRSSLAELLNVGLEESRKTNDGNKNDADDDEDDEFEIVGERIRTIIIDPSYVFSYTNISNDDMVSLQEMVAQSDVGTLKLVDKDDAPNELKDYLLDSSVNNADVKQHLVKPESQMQLSEKPNRTPAAASEVEGRSTLQRRMPETSDAEKKQAAVGSQQQQPQQPLAKESEEKPASIKQ